MKLHTFKTGRWYVDITNSAFAYYCKEIRRYDKTFNQCQVFLKHPFNDGSRHYSGYPWDDVCCKEVSAREAFEINMKCLAKNMGLTYSQCVQCLLSEFDKPSSKSKTDISGDDTTQEDLYAKAFHKNVKKLKMDIDDMAKNRLDPSVILIRPADPIGDIAYGAITWIESLTSEEINKRNDEA